MLNKSGYNEKLEKLMSEEKADNSILETIEKNENDCKKAKSNLEKLAKELENVEEHIKESRNKKNQIPFYKVKDFSQILKDFNNLKKEYRQKLKEKDDLEKLCEEKLNQNSEIEKEIEQQYRIYQENEIYIKAVEKVTKSNIELPADFYTGYVNHMNQYMNSVYSIENNIKLKEPNASDLATLLSLLQKAEQEQKNNNKSTVKETITKKSSTKLESKEENPIEENYYKKVTTKKVI